MQRIVKNMNLGNGMTRYKTRLETDTCEVGTPEHRYHRFNLLRTLADSPDLTTCGPRDFDTAKIFYDGQRWVAEFEADVKP